jgi:AcrR family transcriptional regulator
MSPRSATVNQKIRDERQEVILQAALHLFASKGLVATKISDIAAAAGVSHGLVHHYFSTKEEIYQAVLDTALSGTANLMRQVYAEAATPWERLENLCAAMLEGIRDTPEYILLVIQTTVSEALPPEARARLRSEESALDGITALIREGQAAGEVVAGDPLELALAYTALIQGLAIHRLDDRPQTQEHFPTVQTVLNLLRAR